MYLAGHAQVAALPRLRRLVTLIRCLCGVPYPLQVRPTPGKREESWMRGTTSDGSRRRSRRLTPRQWWARQATPRRAPVKHISASWRGARRAEQRHRGPRSPRPATCAAGILWRANALTSTTAARSSPWSVRCAPSSPPLRAFAWRPLLASRSQGRATNRTPPEAEAASRSPAGSGAAEMIRAPARRPVHELAPRAHRGASRPTTLGPSCGHGWQPVSTLSSRTGACRSIAGAAAPDAPGHVSSQGGQVKLEDLLGKHVRYKGEEGHVVEGHSGEEASVVVSIRGTRDVARRNVTVPESEWEELELLG